jgi:hypothetical protein
MLQAVPLQGDEDGPPEAAEAQEMPAHPSLEPWDAGQADVLVDEGDVSVERVEAQETWSQSARRLLALTWPNLFAMLLPDVYTFSCSSLLREHCTSNDLPCPFTSFPDFLYNTLLPHITSFLQHTKRIFRVDWSSRQGLPGRVCTGIYGLQYSRAYYWHWPFNGTSLLLL